MVEDWEALTASGTFELITEDGQEFTFNGKDLEFHLSYVEGLDYVFTGQCRNPELAEKQSVQVGPFRYSFQITVHTNQYEGGRFKCGFSYLFGLGLKSFDNNLDFEFDEGHPDVRYA